MSFPRWAFIQIPAWLIWNITVQKKSMNHKKPISQLKNDSFVVLLKYFRRIGTKLSSCSNAAFFGLLLGRCHSASGRQTMSKRGLIFTLGYQQLWAISKYHVAHLITKDKINFLFRIFPSWGKSGHGCWRRTANACLRPVGKTSGSVLPSLSSVTTSNGRGDTKEEEWTLRGQSRNRL